MKLKHNTELSNIKINQMKMKEDLDKTKNLEEKINRINKFDPFSFSKKCLIII